MHTAPQLWRIPPRANVLHLRNTHQKKRTNFSLRRTCFVSALVFLMNTCNELVTSYRQSRMSRGRGEFARKNASTKKKTHLFAPATARRRACHPDRSHHHHHLHLQRGCCCHSDTPSSPSESASFSSSARHGRPLNREVAEGRRREKRNCSKSSLYSDSPPCVATGRLCVSFSSRPPPTRACSSRRAFSSCKPIPCDCVLSFALSAHASARLSLAGPLFQSQFHLSAYLVGIIMALTGPLSGILLQPLVGGWSDRYRSKWGKARCFGLPFCRVFLFRVVGWRFRSSVLRS